MCESQQTLNTIYIFNISESNMIQCSLLVVFQKRVSERIHKDDGEVFYKLQVTDIKKYTYGSPERTTKIKSFSH